MEKACVVLRSFNGPGGMPFLPGELVDGSEFRLLDKLVEQKKLRVATKREIESSVEVDDVSGVPRTLKLKARKRKGGAHGTS